MTLIPHLGHQLRLGQRLLAKNAGLVHRGHQRLLHIDVFAGIHRRLGDHRMQMVGRCHQDAVNTLVFCKHFAKVAVALRLDELLLQPHALGPRVALRIGQQALHLIFAVGEVDIADSTNMVGLCHPQRILRAHAAESDDGDIHRIAGRAPAAPEHTTRHDERRARSHHCAEGGTPCARHKLPASQVFFIRHRNAPVVEVALEFRAIAWHDGERSGGAHEFSCSIDRPWIGRCRAVPDAATGLIAPAAAGRRGVSGTPAGRIQGLVRCGGECATVRRQQDFCGCRAQFIAGGDSGTLS